MSEQALHCQAPLPRWRQVLTSAADGLLLLIALLCMVQGVRAIGFRVAPMAPAVTFMAASLLLLACSIGKIRHARWQRLLVAPAVALATVSFFWLESFGGPMAMLPFLLNPVYWMVFALVAGLWKEWHGEAACNCGH